jgi:hypothetical protein
MMEGSQAERNKRAIAAVKFCVSRGRVDLAVQRIQKLNLCTRRREFGGAENSKVESVHQEDGVRWCRENKFTFHAPKGRRKTS